MQKTTKTDYYTYLDDPHEAVPYMERLQKVVGGKVEKLVMFPVVTQWHLTVTFTEYTSGLMLGVDKVGDTL